MINNNGFYVKIDWTNSYRWEKCKIIAVFIRHWIKELGERWFIQKAELLAIGTNNY